MYAQYSTSTTASPSTFFSELETLSQLNNNSNCSSGYSSYVGSPSPTSVPSPNLMQRSLSSHSFNNNGTHHPFSAIFAEDAPVRRACSTGDLQVHLPSFQKPLQQQRVNGMQQNHHTDSPLSSESSVIIEGMSRACRYSPEEKKVRIERYRSKRNQRNFNKKIKYACRKTLADSRPRIRGRFARNDEINKNTRIQWNQVGSRDQEDEEDENWVTMLDSFVAANFTQESQDSSSFGLFY